MATCHCPTPFAVATPHETGPTCIIGYTIVADEARVICWCDRVRGRHARTVDCIPDDDE